MLSEPVKLEVRNVSFSYSGGFSLSNMNLSIKARQMIALIGPNGCGKTTLIKLASGVLSPAEGQVLLDGVKLHGLTRQSIAQKIAVVPQQFSIPFAYTVEEVVLLGRTPFVRRSLFGESEKDRQIVDTVLKTTGLDSFNDRFFNDLSGGERQKVLLAMALAQHPELILLDEPTAHLDINHQVEILELLHKLNTENNVTVVAAIHDLNLAALYFNRLVLLNNGSVFTEGLPEEVITKEIVEKVFLATVEVSRHPGASIPHVVVMPRHSRFK